MGEASEVAAYFDLDGTLLNASSEKTLTGVLAKRRPWRIPHATVAWMLGTTFGLLTGKAPLRCFTKPRPPLVGFLEGTGSVL